MSKTYRRNGEDRRRRGSRRERRAGEAVFAVEPAEPKHITREWAETRIADRLRFVVAQLQADGWIEKGEAAYYRHILLKLVLDGIANYDPELKDGSGRRCGPTHFLFMVLDRRVLDMKRGISRYRGNAVEVPISMLPQSEALRLGYVSAESLSDGCKAVKDLELKMDVNTLRGMLTRLEAEILDARLCGYTHEEIGGRTGLSRFQINRVMEGVRYKARKCGFFPPSEVRPQKASEK